MDDGGCTNSMFKDADLPTLSQPGVIRTVHSYPIALIMLGDSIRSTGISAKHTRRLIESTDQLPPILIHRSTRKVVDGVHRLRAAQEAGRATIDVTFFDGDEDEAFIAAVRANTTHGLPLSLADRTAAAARIVGVHPEWSDRRIAEQVGLSPKTVGSVRRRACEEIPHTHARVGRDGRVRRVRSSAGIDDQTHSIDDADDDGGPPTTTSRASRAVSGHAASTAVSADTARNAMDPCPATHVLACQMLRRDPSLRMTEVGRRLLWLLELHLIRLSPWQQLAANVPPHQAALVKELAFECAKTWQDFGEKLEKGAATTMSTVSDSR